MSSKQRSKQRNVATNRDGSSSKAPPTKKLRLSQSWSHFREFVQTKPKETGSYPRGVAPFPEVRWTDKQEIWDLICNKERGMYIREPGNNLLGRHPNLQPKMRSILLDWLIEVCEVYKLHRETFYLAVDFTDRYLGTTINIPKSRVQLIGIASLFVAAKIEEIYPPKLQEFAYVTDGACSEEEILSMELILLKGLNWGLSPMTPNSWVKLYLQVSQAKYIVDINGANPPGNEDFVLAQYCGLRFSKVMQLLDLCILDIGALSFPYSVLAASAIFHCHDEETALQASGYHYHQISDCVDWMSCFVFALRESLTPVTSPSLKSMSNICPEDVYNIQVHAFELEVFERAQLRLEMILERASRLSPDLNENCRVMLSSVEMTPPEETDDYVENSSDDGVHVPQKHRGVGGCFRPSHSDQISPTSSTTSSVFLTPTLSAESW